MEIQKIQQFNPWFKDKKFRFKEGKLKPRFIYKNIKSALLAERGFIISLSGLRRTGKTTILKQLANDFLSQDQSVFYYQFSQTGNNLKDVLDYFIKEKLDGEIYKTKAVFLFDELQYVENWQDTLKHYYDINRSLQFIITGSASLYLHENTKESLAGRILDFYLRPFSFDEYLSIKYDYRADFFFDLTADISSLAENLKKRSERLKAYGEEIWGYLIKGEFPELLNTVNYQQSREYLENSIVDKIFRKDIRVFEVEKIRELRILYKILLQNVAQTINEENIAREIELSRPTVRRYIDVLSGVYLINIVKNNLRSVRKQEKSFDKVFSESINLVCSSLAIRDIREIIFPDFSGHLIENYVFNQIKKGLIGSDEVYYFNKDKKEVDFVCVKGKNVLPIEVKSATKLKGTDLNHLFNYLEKNNLQCGICFYGGQYDQVVRGEKTVHLINWL